MFIKGAARKVKVAKNKQKTITPPPKTNNIKFQNKGLRKTINKKALLQNQVCGL